MGIVGAESTGKTSLAKALAQHYRTRWVPEYAREYLQQLPTAYLQADVEAIAKGQVLAEMEATENTDGLLICDTNLLVIKIWMDHSYGATPEWILNEIDQHQYHLHILTDDDIPYEPDPLREHPEMRDYFTLKYLEELENRKLKYLKVTGNEAQRLFQSIQIIDTLL